MTSLTSIYANCTIQGDCKIWRGGTSRKGYPFIYMPEVYRKSASGRGMRSGRVAVWMLKHKAGGQPEGKKIVMTCRNRLCLWHGHMQAMGYSEAQQFAKDGGAYSSLKRKIACVANARKSAKLTMEKAREIRYRVLVLKEDRQAIADELRVYRSTIDMTMSGKRWAEYSAANNSVFNMAV